MRWQDYQLNRLETVFAVIILLIILSAILNRVVVYLTIAEQALVTNVVTNMNTALRFTEAEYFAGGRRNELPDLAGRNPVALISSRPDDYTAQLTDRPEYQALLNLGAGRPLPNYLGSFENPTPDEYPRGSWYFDESGQALVYMVRNRELFHSPLDGPERIRFRVELDYRDRNNNDRYDRGVDKYRGIKFRSLDEYDWLI